MRRRYHHLATLSKARQVFKAHDKFRHSACFLAHATYCMLDLYPLANDLHFRVATAVGERHIAGRETAGANMFIEPLACGGLPSGENPLILLRALWERCLASSNRKEAYGSVDETRIIGFSGR